MTSVAITRDELAVWSRYIHEISGIHLDDSKGYLLETRLAGPASESGAGNLSEFFYKARVGPDQYTSPQHHRGRSPLTRPPSFEIRRPLICSGISYFPNHRLYPPG